MHPPLIAMILALANPSNVAVPLVGKSVSVTVPVYPGEISRPYQVVGEIKDNLRKHFAFQADPTEEKIYAELWERGRKMGADAVIHARYGPTKGTMFNHGRTPISGVAIKFLDAPPSVAK